MKTIDVDKAKFTLNEVAEMAQAAKITLCRGETALAVVLSHYEYKQIQRLKLELARSKTENIEER